ncbi:hypothetical protein L1887_30570 [Cichorium endivia]|nr:hypothetical protein L1887_30570 [Cichorium endivia]
MEGVSLQRLGSELLVGVPINHGDQSTILELVVKDKDLVSKDDFFEKLRFDIIDVSLRVPSDSPLDPQSVQTGRQKRDESQRRNHARRLDGNQEKLKSISP